MAPLRPSDALATRAVHADDPARTTRTEAFQDVAPPLHVSTTYRYIHEVGGEAAPPADEKPHVYSRETHPTRDRLEQVLGSIEGGHAVVYASGLTAIHAALLYFRPRRVAIRGGYHGAHNVIKLFQSVAPLDKIDIEPATGTSSWEDHFREGDLIWLETPKNPTGELADVARYVAVAKKVNARVVADATFAPPPLQYLLPFGVDAVMHSSTKGLGGHSDALGGVLVVPDREAADTLRAQRTVFGGVPGNMETWLLLRSLRSLAVRIRHQSNSATAIIQYLRGLPYRILGADGLTAVEKQRPAPPHVLRLWHSSVPDSPGSHLAASQMPGGHSSIFSIETTTEEIARALPGRLRLFSEATSLGGAESLIEWRRKYDSAISPLLLRVSIGLEDTEDLIEDFAQALGSFGSQ